MGACLTLGMIACGGLSPGPQEPHKSQSVSPESHEAAAPLDANETSEPVRASEVRIAPPPVAEATKEPIATPFRLVLGDSYGSTIEHDGHRIWVGDSGMYDLTAQESVAPCSYPRGVLMSGKNLYFAARLSPFSACPDSPMLMQHTSGSWKVHSFIDAHHVLVDEWVHGTTIAAVVPYRSGPPWGYELVKVAGAVTPPRSKRSTAHLSGDPNQRCYSELERPLSLHAFPSGAIHVVGESRCSAAPEDEDLSLEQERKLYRPAIESFPRGKYQSTIVVLPVDRILSILEEAENRLWIVGEVHQKDGEAEPLLLLFDGTTVRHVSLPLDEGKQPLLGPSSEAAPALQSGGVAAESESGEDLARLWLINADVLAPAVGTAAPIPLPHDCNPGGAWFKGKHAWVVCEAGLFTTDPDQAPIELSEVASDCETFFSYPKYAVRGLYQKSSDVAGCGPRATTRKGGKLSPLPKPQPQPQHRAAPLRFEF